MAGGLLTGLAGAGGAVDKAISTYRQIDAIGADERKAEADKATLAREKELDTILPQSVIDQQFSDSPETGKVMNKFLTPYYIDDGTGQKGIRKRDFIAFQEKHAKDTGFYRDVALAHSDDWRNKANTAYDERKKLSDQLGQLKAGMAVDGENANPADVEKVKKIERELAIQNEIYTRANQRATLIRNEALGIKVDNATTVDEQAAKALQIKADPTSTPEQIAQADAMLEAAKSYKKETTASTAKVELYSDGTTTIKIGADGATTNLDGTPYTGTDFSKFKKVGASGAEPKSEFDVMVHNFRTDFQQKNGRQPSPAEENAWIKTNKLDLARAGSTGRAEGTAQVAAEQPGSYSKWTDDEKAQSYENFIINNQRPRFSPRDPASMGAWERGYNSYILKQGATAEDIGEKRKYREAQGVALKDNEKYTVATERFVKVIDKNIDLVKKLKAKHGGDLAKVYDRAITGLVQGVMGDGDVLALQQALLSLSNEVGKVESGSMGIAEVSASQAEKWAKIHDWSLPYSELDKVLNTSKELGRLRLESLNEVSNKYRRSLKTKEGKVPSFAQDEAAAVAGKTQPPPAPGAGAPKAWKSLLPRK